MTTVIARPPYAMPTSAAGPALPAPGASPELSMRRITVVAATGRLDVALPASCTVAELLPQLVHLTRSTAVAGQGWILQRIAEAPLHPGDTLGSAGIADGEVLRLAPLEHLGPPPVFDDPVDAVADVVGNRSRRWCPDVARRVAIGVLIVAFAASPAPLVLGTERPWWTIGLGAAALYLTIGALLVRGGIDRAVGTALVAAGGSSALIGGLGTAAAIGTGGAAESVTVALAAVAGYAGAAVGAVGGMAGFGAVVAAGGLGSSTAAVVALTGVEPTSAAAVLLTLTVLLSPAFPALALRLGRIPMPRIPADVGEFRAEERPTTAHQVGERAASAERVLTGLSAALVALVMGSAVVLAGPDRFTHRLLIVLAGLGLWLRSRSFPNLGQRVVLLLGGGTVLAIAAVALARSASIDATGLGIGIGGAVLLIGTCALIQAIRSGRGRSSSPYAARLLDVCEFLVLAGLVPTAGAVAGLFGFVQGVGAGAG